ncbi:hypothetical protein COV17_01000 [Candidatus Woesearchaeota archaeon CG10_big_fil_rev_8_21_14_0_10_36_11]|nr:MAG: hypothetical protein COV17_01000 [Candidatus Woesearchaeota archaeon CG10_big_fil_rev_8_21_14_0_10_36_11]
MRNIKLREVLKMNIKNILLVAILVLFASSVFVSATNDVDLVVDDFYITSVADGHTYNLQDTFTVGETLNVHITLRNWGTSAITNQFQVEIMACHPDGTGCHIASNVEVHSFGAERKGSYKVPFTFSAHDIVNGKSMIKIVVDGDGQVAETSENNNIETEELNVQESFASVLFGVSVNDWPEHKNSALSKTIKNAYVNMYTVVLDGDAFKVVGVETKSTGPQEYPVARFTIEPQQLVYFEGFRTREGAVQGAEQKKSLLWTAPPYKNFGNNRICQTDYTNINQMLGQSESYACATMLSVPYKDVGVVSFTYPDLTITSLTHGDTSFKALVCNVGEEAIANFKITFEANGKENTLTYVPTLSTGSCVEISSWGYSHFGIQDTYETVDAKAEVDPYNEFIESDETNNVAVITPSSVLERNWVEMVFVNRRIAGINPQGFEYDLVPINFYPTAQNCVVEYSEKLCIEKAYVTLGNDGRYDKVILWLRVNSIGTKTFELNARDNTFVALHELDNDHFRVELNPMLMNLRFYPTEETTIDSVIDESQLPGPSIEPQLVNGQNVCTIGCAYKDKCLPAGTRIKVGVVGEFCNWDDTMAKQLDTGESCSNNYECGTNSCVSGQCVDLAKRLDEQQNLLEKILEWLRKIFG